MSECCNHNCNEGRACPERTRRIQENDSRWAQDAIGCECALPPIVDEPRPRVWHFTFKGWWLVVAVSVIWYAIAVWG